MDHHRRGSSCWNFLGVFVILRYLRTLSCYSAAAVAGNVQVSSAKDTESLNFSRSLTTCTA